MIQSAYYDITFEMKHRHYQLPDSLHPRLLKIFKEQNWDWSPKKIADDILRLSDFYIQNPKATTPWDQAWAQKALLCYYWPLNTLRFQSVYQELQESNFFNGIDQFIDFGAGPATAASVLYEKQKSVLAVETSTVPQKWFPEIQWAQNFQVQSKTCFILSYSLTEMSQLPTQALQSDALIIIEPASQVDGRNLLQLRSELIKQKYSVWAPCSHQDDCPLLVHSKTDWCHDRIHFEAPTWFLEIEHHLPIKNKTLTMSYLAVKKQSPAPPTWARLTGDLLNEKGKSRQLICRGPQREFLAWMHRDGEVPEYFRGEKVLVSEFEQKSNELRVKSMKRWTL